MKPLISRIRAGDVLYGTRNLRMYLQTASLYRVVNYATKCAGGVDPLVWDGAPSLYVPKKDDKFIVAVNTHNRFAVWSPNQKAVLLFLNPVQSQPAGKLRGKHVSSGVTTNGTRWGGGDAPDDAMPDAAPENLPRTTGPTRGRADRMSPALFSSWFIRTRFKRPDLTQWPSHAWYLYCCLQLNTVRWGTTSWGGMPLMPYSLARDGNGNRQAEQIFELAKLNTGCERAKISPRAYQLIGHGVGRDKAIRDASRSFGVGYGPLLADVKLLRERIKEMSGTPRMLAILKGADEQIVQVLKKAVDSEASNIPVGSGIFDLNTLLTKEN